MTDKDDEVRKVNLARDGDELLQWLGVVLDQVDYTSGACDLTEMVGACLPKEVIQGARDAIARYRKLGEVDQK